MRRGMTEELRFDTPMGEEGKRLLRRLTEAGHAAYFVGGCVRDALLGRPVHDIDIATSAAPERVMSLFPDAIPTGVAHGTVTVPSGKWSFEVTTFRAESAYSDGRRPDAVSFLDDIEGDLERRDFTVNAMAVDLAGRLVDPFGGRRDLAGKRLRAVGDASARFAEDALRLLRLVRIAAEYDFAPEEETWREAKLAAPRLAVVAMERVHGELKRMISGRDPYRAICLLAESELLRWTKTRLRLPRGLGLAAFAEGGAGAEETASADDPLERLALVADETARWAFWFARMGLAPGECLRVLRDLRLSAAFADRTSRLLALHDALRTAPADDARRCWTLAAVQYGESACRRWLTLAPAVAAHPGYAWAAPYAAQGERWLEAMPVKSPRELAVGGDDVLAAAGARRGGPWVAGLLDRLTREAALGAVANERGALLAAVDRLLPEFGQTGAGDGERP